MVRIINFMRRVGQLKRIRRAGWVHSGVREAESVADHAFGVALLTLLASKGLDRERCLMMAILHDAAEAITGDITPHDPIPRVEKTRRERQAIQQLVADLGDASILELWEEFEAAQTPEAKLVRDLDYIEMALQATEYRQSGDLSPSAAAPFIATARQKIQTDLGRELLRYVVED